MIAMDGPQVRFHERTLAKLHQQIAAPFRPCSFRVGVTSLSVGSTAHVTARAVYTVGLPADVSGTATWVSSDPAVATVSGGIVTAVAPGHVNIYATVNDSTQGLVTSSAASFTVTSGGGDE